MGHIRAQVTTRSGPAGTKDAPTVTHGDWDMSRRGELTLMRALLSELMQAAQGVAADGMVTEVAVLVYPGTLADLGARRARG